MNQFNNLPPEIIEFIFKKVNLKDLVNLRIVDKRFKQICDQFKIKQLSLSMLDEYSIWFYTNDSTYSNKENQLESSKILNYKSIFKLDKYLRRLSIRFNEDFNISILNEFKLLEQLDMTIYELNDNYKLNLNNLKVASIFLNYSKFRLTLDTNQLFAFKSNNSISRFIFNYPDKILFYETNYYYYDDYDDDNDDYKIKEFINLEYLKLIDLNSTINCDILSTFKNLKTLDLNIDRFMAYEYDNLKEDIISILQDKENLKRSELQIYLVGVKLINRNQLNQFKWSSDLQQFHLNLLEFQIKNYDLLKDNCSYIRGMPYCFLIKLIKTIPSSFMNKFPHIRAVASIYHIDDEDQFIKFLNNLKYLDNLELINCGLSKSFYDQLINLIYLNDLEYLKIEEEKDLEMNFDFILHLKKLNYFKTNQTINNYIDSISKLFKENQKIKNFIFKFDTENYIRIFNSYTFHYYKIRSYYLDDNLKEIDNFSISDLKLDEVILKLENLKF